MSNPPPRRPEWPAPSDYANPSEFTKSDDDAQKVFDTVVGPNMRLVDNLIQLAAIVVGTLLGALIGYLYNRSQGNDLALGGIVGGFAGLLLSLFLSGFLIGAVRAVLAVKR